MIILFTFLQTCISFSIFNSNFVYIFLQSLSQLLGEISNIVINDAVGDSIFKAVVCIERAAHFLTLGKLMEAFNESKDAFLSAEAAFTDPSLLALLYFPDDQK